MKSTINIEQAILDIAEKMFLEKGFAMVSTTDIANKVGCNQAMVHYYYRTKEKLFMKVFTNKVDSLFMTFSKIIDAESSLYERINMFIDNYFDLFIKNPRIPFLVINELLLNPNRMNYLQDYISQKMVPNLYSEFDRQVKEEILLGHIRQIETFDLLQNIISLTVFTFVGIPVIEGCIAKSRFNMDDYIQHRRIEIKILIKQGISV